MPWRFTLPAKPKDRIKPFRMPRARPVEAHVCRPAEMITSFKAYLGNVNLHGTSPWHLAFIRRLGAVVASMKLHRTSLWYLKTHST